jgi:hypothetical protein
MQLPNQQTNRGFYMKALIIFSLTIFSLNAFAEKAEIGQRNTDCGKISQAKEKVKDISSKEDAPSKEGKKSSAK